MTKQILIVYFWNFLFIQGASKKKFTIGFPKVLLYFSGNMKATKMAVIVEDVVGVVTKDIFITTFLFQVTFDKILEIGGSRCCVWTKWIRT